MPLVIFMRFSCSPRQPQPAPRAAICDFSQVVTWLRHIDTGYDGFKKFNDVLTDWEELAALNASFSNIAKMTSLKNVADVSLSQILNRARFRELTFHAVGA